MADGTKRAGFGGFALDILFGKGPTEGASTFNYQHRMSKHVFSMHLPLFFWTVMVALAPRESLSGALVLAFIVLYSKIHYATATSSDAVLGSLWERVNLQSQWLDSRLDSIESRIDFALMELKEVGPLRRDLRERGQSRWNFEHRFSSREQMLSSAYDWYPEAPVRQMGESPS